MTFSEFCNTRCWSTDLTADTGFDHGPNKHGVVFDQDVVVTLESVNPSVWRAVWLHEVRDFPHLYDAARFLYDNMKAEGLI